MTIARTLLPCMALVLAAGCADDSGTCLLGTAAQPWACLEYASQINSSDAENNCSVAGGTWQESSCSLESAMGACQDLGGSSSIYYPEYLTAFSLSEVDLQMSCEEAQGVYTDY